MSLYVQPHAILENKRYNFAGGLNIRTLHEYLNKYPYAELVSQDGLTRFSICTYRYAYPEITTDYDADWHRNLLSISLPAFCVEIDEAIFQGEGIEICIAELKEFTCFKKSVVIVEPIESFFSLEFSFNAKKNVMVKGSAEYPLGWGSRLEYQFETDLSYVDKFISGLEHILGVFPVRT